MRITRFSVVSVKSLSNGFDQLYSVEQLFEL